MTKWPVGGSVADRPEGVLQNGKENLGWPEVAYLRHVRNSVILQIAFRVMCHRTV